MNRIKVGDTFLESNSLIAQTFKVNTLGDITTRQGGSSNDFTFPLSSTNRKALGFPEDLNNISRNQYKRIEAFLYDGNTFLSKGDLKINKVNSKNIQATFFSDNVGWINRIKDKTLKDLNLDDLDHDWNGANIRASFNNTNDDGYIYPFIEYGRTYDSDINSTNFAVSNFYPAVYVKRVFEQIFKDVDYSIKGDLLNVWEYNNSIIPFSEKDFSHSEQFIRSNTQSFNVEPQALSKTSNIIKSNPATLTDLQITLQPVKYTLNVSLELTSVAGGGFPISVFLGNDYSGSKLNAVTVIQSIPTGFSGGVGFSVEIDASQYTNNFFIGIDGAAASFTFTISSGSISFTPLEEISPDEPIQIASTLPSIKQSDFVKYIANTFGLIISTDKTINEISFDIFDRVKNNIPLAKDWSNKIDTQNQREVNFTEFLQSYAKTSIFNYLDNKDDPELEIYNSVNSDSFGSGVLNIQNEHISNRKEIYKAPFSPTINILTVSNQLYLPQIKWFDENLEKEFDPIPRILLIVPDLSVEELTGSQGTQINVAGTNVSNIPFAWFAKAAYTPSTNLYMQSLSFGDITFTPDLEGKIAEYWGNYLEILNNMKYLKASFALNAVDINELDFKIPIYLDDYKSYFFINSVNEYTGGEELTDVELVKIS